MQQIDKLDQIHIGKKGAAPIAAPGWTAKSKERVRLVDCDVHHSFREAEEPPALFAEVLPRASARSRLAPARQRLRQYPLPPYTHRS